MNRNPNSLAPRLTAWIIGLVVFGFYAAASHSNQLIYDDELLIEDEVRPRSAGELLRVFGEPHYRGLPYYRPIVRLTYLIQKAFHGNAPGPYHLFNAAMIGLVAVAAYELLRLPRFGITRPAAALAVAWFALHPIASSCVLPVAGRETLIAALWVLLAVYGHCRTGRAWRAVALAGLALALFSKEQAIATPLLFLAADASGAADRPRTQPWVARYAPVAVLLVGYLAARAAVLGGGVEVALWERPAGPLQALLYGLQVVVVPFAELVYEPSWPMWLSPPRVLVALAVVGLVAWTAARAPDRAVLRSPLGFWVAWFVVTQLPSANIFRQESRFDERYLFVASLALPAVGAMLVSSRWRRAGLVRLALVAATLPILSLAATSWHRAQYFADSLAFHRQWLRTNPDAANAHNGLGVALARDGRHEDALSRFHEALRLNPRHDQASNNRGVSLQALGRSQEAIAMFEKALEVNPAYAEAHYNLANSLSSVGRLGEAADRYEQALALKPDYPQALNNHAALLISLGRIDEAMTQLETLMALDEGHARSRVNYAILLARSGHLAEAVPFYEQALRLDPDYAEAHFNLAMLLSRLGRRGEAVRHLELALRSRPDWPEASRALDALSGGVSP